MIEENTLMQKDEYKNSRILYIIEAALEYFISLTVAGAYLAKLSTFMGFSDSFTGILTSFVSLGCSFQIIAVFLANKRPVKRWVMLLHTLNQLFFALVYVVPFFSFSLQLKMVLFVAFLLLGHAVNNIVNSPKINWYMSLVDDKKRGTFTANKEIISLISGIVFSFALGSMVDYFEAKQKMQTAFILCAVGIVVLTVGHTATLLFSKEKPVENQQKTDVKAALGSLIKDKNLLKVVLVSVLWNVASYATTPFYGTYQNNELGFSLTLVSLLSTLGALVRASCSRTMGRYADKHSFTNMLNICFLIVMVAFAVNIFTVPANGKIFYAVYIVLHAIAMAGINSGAINLIYDYVEAQQRTAALALKSTLAGLAGFLSTLAISPLVSYIQSNNNTLFGVPVYAQQVTSAIAFVLVGILLIYLNCVVKKIKTNNNI